MDAGAADLAGRILGGAEVLVVVDDAVVGGGRERVELERAIGVHVADVGHVVDVVSGGQVPAQDGVGGAARGAGQGHPHRAGEGHPLQGGVHKVQPSGDHILTVDWEKGETWRSGDIYINICTLWLNNSVYKYIDLSVYLTARCVSGSKDSNVLYLYLTHTSGFFFCRTN